LPELHLVLISSLIKAWFATVIPKYLDFATLSKDLLTIFVLRFCPAFLWRDSNICLVFSVFTSKLTFLLASVRAYVFLFIVFLLPGNRFTSSHQHRPKLTCPIQFEFHLVFLVFPNGIKRSWKGIVLKHPLILGHFEWETSQTNVGFEVYTAVVMKSIIFWDMMPCSPLSFNRRFGGTSPSSGLSPAYLLVSCWTYFLDPDDGGDVPPKRRLALNGLHSVISQKMILFISDKCLHTRIWTLL
jgi:hypothetical protein